MACGHRLMLGSHTTTSSTVAALVTRWAALPAASPRQVTNYGWRTRRWSVVGAEREAEDKPGSTVPVLEWLVFG